MSTNMQGHNHGGKSHLLGMLGIGAVLLVALLATGRSLQQALPTALFLACPLMMVGMMFMMRGGNGQQHDNDATDHHNQQHHGDPQDHRENDSTAEWQDTVGTPSSRPPKGTPLH